MASDPDGVYRGQNLGLRGFPMDGLRTNDYHQERQCKGDRKRRLTSFMGTCNLEDSNKKMKKLVWGSRTFVDREPGEFSGGSSSGVEDGVKKSEDEDEATSGKKKKLSQSVLDLVEKKQISYRIEDRVNKLEDEDEATSKKKRKLSPSVCDLENKKIVHLHNAKTWNVSHAQFLLPSLPAMTKVFSEPKPVRRVKNTEQLCASLVQKESIRYAQGLHVEDGDEPEQMEEKYGRSRAISSSRWADANYVIDDDECTTYGVNFSTKRRKKLPFISQDQKSDSSEVIVGEGSEGSVSNASVSCDLFLEEDLNPLDNKIDYIYAPVKETDVEENDVSIETDTKDAICSFKMSEFVAPPYKRINMLQCCRSVDEFEKLNKINEGTYGIVFRARDKKSGEIVALKKVKMDKEREGFPLTSLREINILLSLYHPSIVEVKEVVMGSNLDGIFTVMEYMEHDLKGLIETMNKHFHLSEIKCLMLQLISGVKHLHDNWVLHRDLKPSNLLFNNRGELKICDFGLSRQYGSPLKPYTQMVVTLWYRAPELLLGAKEYSTAIDMWSVGCIMAELLAKEPLFPGKSELDQLDKIFNVLGTPDEKMWPGFTRLPGAKSKFTKKSSKLHEKFPRMSTSFFVHPSLSNTGFDLLNKLFTYDPDKRITAVEALNHPWFVESPLPTSKDFMPTFPAQHVQDRHQRKALKISDSLNLRR